ncbi:MAG: hypothetical protein QNJ78_11615 [Gammaproteobacteria bacterium]|nr:hypothetical protein [Gammaproteobacteria bacterium]
MSIATHKTRFQLVALLTLSLAGGGVSADFLEGAEVDLHSSTADQISLTGDLALERMTADMIKKAKEIHTVNRLNLWRETIHGGGLANPGMGSRDLIGDQLANPRLSQPSSTSITSPDIL